MMRPHPASALLLLALLAACAGPPRACVPVGAWVDPASGAVVADPLPAAARRGVALLGERHDSAADHRWQLAAITQLAAAEPHLALGFEMFPRRTQPALDRWVAGGFASDQAFLDAVDWAHVWGFNPALYLPMFRFARDHRLAMLALNVAETLPRRVAHEGWAAIPPAEREGVGEPAAPSPAYRDRLAAAMAGHGGPALGPDALDRFVAAQLVWDRAMAEIIAAARRGATPGASGGAGASGAPLVVAIMGAGHLEHRDGVPHQLAALGVGDAAVLLPWPADADCADLAPDLADAVYGVPADPPGDA